MESAKALKAHWKLATMTMTNKITLLLLLILCIGCAPTPLATPHVAENFGLGRTATPAEIAEWDIDIRPDGEGLPQGKGSVAAGRVLYATACARCHGESGIAGPFGSLVGRVPDDAFPFAENPRLPKTIGNYWPYATTIFDYVRRAMPLDQPGSLEDDEVYALTAFLLHENGLLDEDTEIDRESLPKIQMPARDRFIFDDRKGGPEIR